MPLASPRAGFSYSWTVAPRNTRNRHGPLRALSLGTPQHPADGTAGRRPRHQSALDAQALEVEGRLLSRADRQSDDKFFAEPYALYLNLVWLNAEVGSGGGDVSGGADHRPTDASLAILADLERQLADARVAYATFRDTTLPAFNREVQGRMPAIKWPEGRAGR